jgi:hypothetical protein
VITSRLFIVACIVAFCQSQPICALSQNICKGSITYDSTLVVSINKSLPKYYVHLIEREDTSGEYNEWNYTLSFRISANGPITQTICDESGSPFTMMEVEKYPGIEFIDLNFDGYLDIKMFNNRAANGVNAGYAAYLFDPLTRQFIHSESFSDILGGTGIELDSEKHEITSSGELGCLGGCWSIDTYKVQGDTLILIRREHQDQDMDHPGDFLLIREEMLNGILTVVSKEKIKWP